MIPARHLGGGGVGGGQIEYFGGLLPKGCADTTLWPVGQRLYSKVLKVEVYAHSVQTVLEAYYNILTSRNFSEKVFQHTVVRGR